MVWTLVLCRVLGTDAADRVARTLWADQIQPLAEARRWTTYRPEWRKQGIAQRLFDIKVNAFALGYPALRKAADAAMKELDAMVWH